ncbi:alpha/beta hydrolase [Phenylobacterium sp.]|uniref:alpha/beta fold hydrolase n=1 Tax=Phenylobacterium sp. TaxID=1871053 RepID=UPI002F418658
MKSIFKWAAIAIVASLALLLATGAVWEQVERRQVAAAYPAPGRLVDIGGGRRMQIECRGAGSPTVVFETGLDYFGALAWSKVMSPVAQITRACAYSRAGIVWSDDKPGPHDALGAAHDLHATLAAAGETGPFVLVGLSMGGPLITTYSGLYGDQVAGLVYVDASHPDQLKRFEAVLGKKSGGGMTAFVQDLGGNLAWTGGPRLVAMAARNNHAESTATMPPRAKEIALAFFATSLRPLAAERDALPETFAEAGAYRNLGARPVVVLTRGKPAPAGELSPAQAAAWDKAWPAMQQDMARWSSRGVQRTVSDASHYIPNDDPDAVIAAVREVVGEVRAGPGPRAP